jgi:hypothetical protein
MDPTHLGLLDNIVTMMRYEYVTMNTSSSLGVASKRIDFLENDVFVSKFMRKFQNQIYKYIKNSHRS